MGFYKVVRVVERIEYVKADNKMLAESPIRDNHVELIEDETVLSETCEEVDEIEVKLYWVNKNNRT